MLRTNYPGAPVIMTGMDGTLVYLMGRTTRVRSRETGELLEVLRGPSDCDEALFTPDGKYVVFHQTTNKIYVYKVGTPHTLCFHTRDTKGSSDDGVALVDEGRVVLVVDKNIIYAYEMPTGKRSVFLEMEEWYRCKRIATKGNRILIFSGHYGGEEGVKVLLYEGIQDTSPKVFYNGTRHGAPKGDFVDENHFVIFNREDNETLGNDYLEGMEESSKDDQWSSKVGTFVWRYAIDGSTDLSVPEKKYVIHVPYKNAFSPDKRYCATLFIASKQAFLYRTDTWERLDYKISKYVWSVGMSPSGKEWLIGANPHSMVLPLPEIGGTS